MSNNEQIHGDNVRHVVTQNGAPSLTCVPASLDLGHARLRHAKSALVTVAKDILYPENGRRLNGAGRTGIP
jgi:hypothetical protein